MARRAGWREGGPARPKRLPSHAKREIRHASRTPLGWPSLPPESFRSYAAAAGGGSTGPCTPSRRRQARCLCSDGAIARAPTPGSRGRARGRRGAHCESSAALALSHFCTPMPLTPRSRRTASNWHVLCSTRQFCSPVSLATRWSWPWWKATWASRRSSARISSGQESRSISSFDCVESRVLTHMAAEGLTGLAGIAAQPERPGASRTPARRGERRGPLRRCRRIVATPTALPRAGARCVRRRALGRGARGGRPAELRTGDRDCAQPRLRPRPEPQDGGLPFASQRDPGAAELKHVVAEHPRPSG